MDQQNKAQAAVQQQSPFDINLDELDKKVKEYRNTQEKNNTLYFFIQDTRRNEFYKVLVDNGNLNFSKENSQVWPLPLNKLPQLMEQIDERLEPYQATHTFFTKDVISRAEQGEVESLKNILSDYFNDELRREQFFKEVGIPEPQKRIWYK
ncbi:hypothetical protein TTHERM_00463230 (macronuclear) [Tetrahymena thermophila SB210]|uniref:Uncharacterized protein n=1 Tax=Tetrahymena thermophila (strain SB210) TaxID=312017 RepID=Q23PW0_TETTS|nr:hypothetical protein TTHERM_00463230 [Tetrahymena thermophila SB210]EAR98575.2 hypothetical protein TTHERM_00463230 [Tetrahymena thermophila SB210]|eukprot:XP_001018820.2 hypothetical protein TTHERM_00463230 [Tetrahymena thermophila SB210]